LNGNESKERRDQPQACKCDQSLAEGESGNGSSQKGIEQCGEKRNRQQNQARVQAQAPVGICQGRDPGPRADEPETLDCIDDCEEQGQEKNSYQDQVDTPLVSFG